MRLFVAIELDEAQRAAVAARSWAMQEALGAEARRIRWVAPDHLHITLKFLGEVAAPMLEAARRGVRAAVISPPFAGRLGRVSAFPATARPRVIWIGVAAGHEPLVALAEMLDRALVDDGFLPEAWPLVPDVTLGRLRRNAQIFVLSHAIGPGDATNCAEFHVHSVVLIESVLGPAGPTYRTVETVRLGDLPVSGRVSS